MTDPHLDDEQLSLLLDGFDVDGRAHVEDEGCEVCVGRLAALRDARDALAAATVPPLAADVLDRLVGAALSAPPVADVVPLDAAPRRRRIMTPPPGWLIGAAAGLAALVGVAGLLNSVGGSSDDSGDGGSLAAVANDESAKSESDASTLTAEAAAGGTAAAGAPIAGPVDPEVVIADLADQDDPTELAATLGTRGLAYDSATSNFSTAREAAPSAAVGGGATADSAASVPTTSAPVDRAQCRAQADELGAGRFAALLSTATLRWKGTPAEVLVFRLAEPAPGDQGPLTRQALVLSRPGCTLLAETRF